MKFAGSDHRDVTYVPAGGYANTTSDSMVVASSKKKLKPGQTFISQNTATTKPPQLWSNNWS